MNFKRASVVAGCAISILIGIAARARAAGFDKILFPIVTYVPVNGASGSRWVTDVSVANTSAKDVTIAGDFICFACRTTPKLPAGATFRFLPSGNSFLLIERGYGRDVHATVRVHDLSKDALSAGADIPIAREDDFSADRIDLLGIPTDTRFRRTLRIYSLDAFPADVQIRIYLEPETSILRGDVRVQQQDTLAAEFTAHLDAPAQTSSQETKPAYVELSDASIPYIPAAATVRFEIRPLSTGVRIWAFLSLTNNESQVVTVIAPH